MIKSPLNYTGGKYKLLPQMLPLFPKNIDTFYDIFGGGANVAVNVEANRIIYNDSNSNVAMLIQMFKDSDTTELLQQIDSLIAEYNLSKTNKEGYIALRNYYNECRKSVVLYTLICYAFNNQIRFNSKGEYNMPFGSNKSSFNDSLRQKVIAFCDKIRCSNIDIAISDFDYYRNIDFAKDDFVYLDPPYYGSVATYNEGSWSKNNELALYKFIETLMDKNVKFALSNNLSVNPLVKEFATQNSLKLHEIKASYANCNYHKKDKQNRDLEVLITNY